LAPTHHEAQKLLVAPLPLSPPTQAAVARASALSRELRERAGWKLASLDFSRDWLLRLDGRRYHVDSLITSHVEGPKPPGFVLSVGIQSFRSKRPCRERVSASEWFRQLEARIGELYRNEPYFKDDIRFFRRVIGTRPSMVLRELREIESAVLGGARERRRAAANGKAEVARDSGADLWKLWEGLEGSPWRISASSHRLQRRIRRQGCQWELSASLVLAVDGRDGKAGFGGFVDCWSNRPGGASPVDKVRPLLKEAGYINPDAAHHHRWRRGLREPAVEKEVRLLEQTMALMSER
jgi:hypothetical protein